MRLCCCAPSVVFCILFSFLFMQRANRGQKEAGAFCRLFFSRCISFFIFLSCNSSSDSLVGLWLVVMGIGRGETKGSARDFFSVFCWSIFCVRQEGRGEMDDPNARRHRPAANADDTAMQDTGRVAAVRAIAVIAVASAIALVVIALCRVLHAATSPAFDPLGDWSASSSLAVIDLTDVTTMPGGTLRALARRTRVPVLVRFAVPSPWDRDAGAWAQSLAWDRHPFREAEVRHIWRCHVRDSRRGPASARCSMPRSVGSLRSIREGVRARVEAYSRSLGVDDGTWLRRPVAFSHYVARQWMADHPGVSDLVMATGALDVGSAPYDAYRDLKIWLNGPGYCTGTHDDPLDNLSINVCGRKRWLLAPPCDRDCFYPTDRVETTGVQRYRVRNPYVDGAAIDPDTGDALFPRLADARMIEVDVSAGHVLVVPRRWIHFVATTEPSVSFTVNMPSRR